MKIEHHIEIDTSNRKPTQGANCSVVMESGDWRAQLSADSREKITYEILETLKRRFPSFCGYEGLKELTKIAVRFEEKTYTAATSQADYLRKIFLKMLTTETRSEDPMQSNFAANSVNPPIHVYHNTPSFNSQGVSGAAVGDWRAPLERERIVNKIMDTLKENLPFTKYDRLQELKKIAQRVEYEIYTAATTWSEYSRKICLNMLTMETRLQKYMPISMYSNSAAISVSSSVPFNTTANGGDWQEEVYEKIKSTMKDLYLQDLRSTMGASGTFVDPTMESGDWRAHLEAETRQRVVNKIMDTLKRHLPYSGAEGLEELKKIAVRFEEKIYTAATSQPDYLRKMLTMETRSYNAAANNE